MKFVICIKLLIIVIIAVKNGKAALFARGPASPKTLAGIRVHAQGMAQYQIGRYCLYFPFPLYGPSRPFYTFGFILLDVLVKIVRLL